ncbi:uncharacterized protein THITE_2054379 [Thermothielavioides terrestris NRRL 8126]|uniref:Acyl-coenzyme A diphosphatase SCS3 n=1 Tax=Thermothielavioides terrestris (strain ATCC 38088 / NRRL 8126) TaxID=578455 RepID=G2R9R1_THETT|nr:uncharacterized protein THITE_2054379 [Thermothielavioides terrestris NRRL 8126]AEO68749.1 hypothetical protein THITE_2054379 [Thermothielavioides terrestris NRRL 8126]
MDGTTDPQPRRYKSPSDLARAPPSSPPRTARITSTSTTTITTTRRNSPYLPTPTELALLALYPAILLFGAVYAVLSPTVPYPAAAGQQQQQPPPPPPSYFARKDNLLNTLFVKRGWAWITLAFASFVVTHPALAGRRRRLRLLRAAVLRWALVTVWWVFVTQWFFGPALIDRGFRWTGGKCEAVATVVGEGREGPSPAGVVKEVLTAAACKASGGRWSGGHDISGHVFLLVLGSFFLVQEVGWVVARWGRYLGEERCVVMRDGAVKGAAVEAEREGGGRMEGVEEGVGLPVLEALGLGGRFAAAVVGLCVWMLLMTAIYFHTWFEKLTGLLVALAGLYVTYVLPRWVPALRGIVGLPGI